MSVLQEVATDAFQCTPDAGQRVRAYTLFPLHSDSLYTDFTEGGTFFAGKRAGDALFFTAETMAALNTVGRSGWDGVGGDANIVVESRTMTDSIGDPNLVDNAYFKRNNSSASPLEQAPLNSVVIIEPEFTHSAAAALDGVAHEWGHGVISTSPVGQFSRPAIEEGFADIIGQTVEKLRQPAGSGLEKSSDWHLFEDQMNGLISTSNWPARTADWDDGTAGHLWGNGMYPTNDRLHRDDEPPPNELVDVHSVGNQLNVVFKLLAQGGQNVICGRNHPVTGLPFSGCGVNAPGLGFTKARNILYVTLAYYLTYSVEWSELPTHASQAAFDEYSDCSNLSNAPSEQNAVNKAFTAIGYPRQTAAIRCP